MQGQRLVHGLKGLKPSDLDQLGSLERNVWALYAQSDVTWDLTVLAVQGLSKFRSLK